mmetsp:Transcript_18524/g.40494  ORF Transcript_18524/g.40494 Transcript_18524/m.40494 type:complete len:201 (-) Transcript_18524:156-758(-)
MTMVRLMLASGKANSEMATADSSGPMVTCMRVSGSWIRPAAMAFTTTWPEQSMMASGWMIDSMVRDQKFGHMAMASRVTISSVAKTVRATSISPTDPPTRVTSRTMGCMATACIAGLMAESTMDNGLRIGCTGRENRPGRTEALTRVNMWLTRSMGRASSDGPTVVSTKANGSLESSTARALLHQCPGRSHQANGLRVAV